MKLFSRHCLLDKTINVNMLYCSIKLNFINFMNCNSHKIVSCYMYAETCNGEVISDSDYNIDRNVSKIESDNDNIVINIVSTLRIGAQVNAVNEIENIFCLIKLLFLHVLAQSA